jgi:hypothetical protein
MKKLMLVLVCVWLAAPVAAWGQQWVDPSYNSDGSYSPGHWRTPEDSRQERYSSPGKVNPYTGQFTPYTGSMKGPQAVGPPLPEPNPYINLPNYRMRGSSGK